MAYTIGGDAVSDECPPEYSERITLSAARRISADSWQTQMDINKHRQVKGEWA